MSNSFTLWLHTAWLDLLSWFGVEAQKLASFLYPTFKNTRDLIKKDFLVDVIALVPAVAAAILSGGLSAALELAESLLLPLLAKQGIELAQTDINILSNGLVAQAQASLDATAAVAAEKVEPAGA